MLPSLLFSVSFLSPCFFLYLLGSFEVTVTSVSLPPFVSRRGLSNTNQRLSRAPAALYWCGNVVIDRRGDQLGKVLVCVHAVTIQNRGRATRSIDHDTHGHRLGQYLSLIHI